MGARSLIATRGLGVVAAAIAALALGLAGAAGARPRHADSARAHAAQLPGLWNGSKLQVRPSSNTCTPDCADGRFQRMSLALTATRVRNGHFTRLTLHYRYRGQPVADTRCVQDKGPPLVWGTVFHGRCG